MRITELTAKEILTLDQILKDLFAYRADLVQEPAKLKVQTNGDFSFERLKDYCSQIGITLKTFEPKNKQDGFVYFQPVPTEEENDSTVPPTNFSHFYEDFFGNAKKKK